MLEALQRPDKSGQLPDNSFKRRPIQIYERLKLETVPRTVVTLGGKAETPVNGARHRLKPIGTVNGAKDCLKPNTVVRYTTGAKRVRLFPFFGG